MAKTTRKQLDGLTAEVAYYARVLDDINGKFYTYVLNYEKYSGGYALRKYSADKSILLRNDGIADGERRQAKEMRAYLIGARNTMQTLIELYENN